MRKVLFIILVLLFDAPFLLAQTPQEQFTKAKELYDNGKNKECVTALQAVEKQVGANPKIYSLYTNAYIAEKDYTNAAISLNKFKKLVGNKRTDAIQSILDLEKEINSGVETAEKNYKETVAQKRMEEAEKIVYSLETKNNALKNNLGNKHKLYKEEKAKTLTAEEVKETASNLSQTEKIEFYKSLRKSKKIKKHWECVFEDNTLSKIRYFDYKEYDGSGNLIKNLYILNVQPRIIISEEVLSDAYITELINSHKYDTYRQYTYKKSRNGNEDKIETQANENGVIYISSNAFYDDKNRLIKEILFSKDQRTSFENSYEYDENGRYKSKTSKSLQNGIVVKESKKTYTSHSEFESDFTLYEDFGNGKNYTATGLETRNFMGDIQSSTDFLLTSNYTVSKKYPTTYANSYDRYGNIWYQVTSSDQYKGYSCNFYEYEDGYKTGYENYIKLLEQLKLK